MSPNKKLELKNSIIGFLAKNKLGWSASYAEQCGKAFVNILSDVLWYIDGNHRTLKDHGHCVPALFEAFQGIGSTAADCSHHHFFPIQHLYSIFRGIRT